MRPRLPILNLGPSKYVQQSYYKRFYEEAPLSLRELTLLKDVSYKLKFYDSFIMESHDMLLYFKTPLINRFFKWMEFLLELKNSAYFEGIVKGILFCFNRQNLITNQTEFQFEQSKQFLMDLDSIETKSASLTDANAFIVCMLLSSIRPDIMDGSIKQILRKQEQNGFDLSIDWFCLFFGENNPIHFLGQHIEELSPLEIELITASLSGESLRRRCEQIYPMSQREQALLLYGYVKLEKPQTRILERYILVARLLKVNPRALLLVKYLAQTKTFKDELDLFAKDIEFWQSVLTVLYKEWRKNPMETSDYQISNLLDYLEFQRYVPLRPRQFSVKCRTYSSMVLDMNEWHELQDFKATRKDLRISWKPLKGGVFTIRIKKKEYRIEELTTGIALLKEGRKMKHCVYTYLNSCARGSTHIFSLRERKKQGYRHLVTIEVQNGNVVQAKSACNGKLDVVQQEVLEEWMEAVGLGDGRCER